MNKKILIKTAFSNSTLVFGYIVAVAWFFQLAPKIFGMQDAPIWSAAAFLLLFVFSASLTGFLVLGKPILLYLDGAKSDAVKLFLYTVCFLGGALILAFIILAIIARVA